MTKLKYHFTKITELIYQLGLNKLNLVIILGLYYVVTIVCALLEFAHRLIPENTLRCASGWVRQVPCLRGACAATQREEVTASRAATSTPRTVCRNLAGFLFSFAARVAFALQWPRRAP